MALYYGKKLKDMGMVHFAKSRLDKEYHMHLEEKGVTALRKLRSAELPSKPGARGKS
jgi:hypothetical protein